VTRRGNYECLCRFDKGFWGAVALVFDLFILIKVIEYNP
jgi:hypothetical protein